MAGEPGGAAHRVADPVTSRIPLDLRMGMAPAGIVGPYGGNSRTHVLPPKWSMKLSGRKSSSRSFGARKLRTTSILRWLVSTLKLFQRCEFSAFN